MLISRIDANAIVLMRIENLTGECLAEEAGPACYENGIHALITAHVAYRFRYKWKLFSAMLLVKHSQSTDVDE